MTTLDKKIGSNDAVEPRLQELMRIINSEAFEYLKALAPEEIMPVDSQVEVTERYETRADITRFGAFSYLKR